jgi:alpha-ribazole phosphatase
VTLWLVRHATPLIEPGVCYGALDVPADPAATERTAQALAQVLPQGVTVRYSVLQRCELLAKVLHGLRPDLAYKPEPRLVEMNFGQWEGQPWDAIGQSALQAWTDNFAHHCAGGGESVQVFMQRVATVWDELGDEAQAQKQDVVWITHAGVIRACSLLAQGVRSVVQSSDWPQAAPAYGQWVCQL